MALFCCHAPAKPLSVASYRVSTHLSFVNPGVTANTDVHYNRYYCTECHLISTENQAVTMRFGNYTETCRCHNYTPETYTHPVGIELTPEKMARIPDEFPLDNNTITCATCHVMALQCKADESIRKFNPSFLRIRPLPSRTTICYKCHDEAKYKMLDPHRQLDEDGNIVKEKCLYCHRKVPQIDRTADVMAAQLIDLVAPLGELDALCYRCHYKQIKLHPINADHMKKPSLRIAAVMKRSERLLGIFMPLNENGSITCITCHNPHEIGVLKRGAPEAAGAGERGRLRVTKEGDRICLACHQVK